MESCIPTSQQLAISCAERVNLLDYYRKCVPDPIYVKAFGKGTTALNHRVKLGRI